VEFPFHNNSVPIPANPDYRKNPVIDSENSEFGADMQVQLINDGPVTFWLHVA